MWRALKERKTNDKKASRMDLKNSSYFYLHDGISYQSAIDSPDSEHYPIFPKGKQIIGQAMGNLRVPGHGAN